jgi:PAS domain S-box-containing protein
MTILGKLLQPVWEVSSDPIVITGNESNTSDRSIVYVNQAFTRVTGYSSEEALGQSLSLLYGPETDSNSVRASEDQLRTGQSQEYELTHYRKDGSACECTITRAPLVDVDGTSEYIIAMWRVMSESSPVATADRFQQPGMVPLTLPMPLQKLAPASQPRHLTSHPELDALKTLWLEVCGKRALPNRQDFDLAIMKRWAPHLSVAVAMPGGRFQFRLFGTRLTDVYGRDLTGSFLDELTPHDLWSVVIQHYREVVKTRQPIFAPISVSNGKWYTEVSRLLLPLSGNGEVNFVMGADYKREHL